MNTKEFFETVVRMRKAQQDYFASRKRKAPWEESKILLDASQEIERVVDKEIERVKKLIVEPELKFE